MSIAIGQPVARKTDRLFFTGMALASALTLFLGFLPSYFHRGIELPSLTPLYQLHGAFFLRHGLRCWLLKPLWWREIAPTSTVPWALRELSWLRSCWSSALPYRSRR
jgi:hypothetical protein